MDGLLLCIIYKNTVRVSVMFGMLRKNVRFKEINIAEDENLFNVINLNKWINSKFNTSKNN
jgi:hypothetical protein